MSTTTKTISLTRALAEVKALDGRIEKAIERATFIGIVIGAGKNPVNQLSINQLGRPTQEQLVSDIQASMSQIEALTKNRDALRSAIATANMTTKVKFRGNDITIWDLIDYRNHGLPSEEKVLAKMRNSRLQALTIQGHAEDAIKDKAQSALTAMLQSPAGSTTNQADFLALQIKSQQDVSQIHLVDPLDLTALIKVMDERISNARTEIDFLLSEVNSITQITVPA